MRSHKRKLNLVGRKFGKLTVISASNKTESSPYYWNCRCECGNEAAVIVASLMRGATRSCGCGMHCHHVKTHGAKNTPLYSRWRGVLTRTSNRNHHSFHAYGGRGISVCERWHKFENFRDDMGETFETHLEIERIDVGGDYSPENCKWATKAEQGLNQRTNHRIKWNGKILPLTEWSRIIGVNASTLWYRLRRGWTVDRALSTPSRRHGNS